MCDKNADHVIDLNPKEENMGGNLVLWHSGKRLQRAASYTTVFEKLAMDFS